MAKKKSLSEKAAKIHKERPTESGKRRLSKTSLDKIYDDRRAGSLSRARSKGGPALLRKIRNAQKRGSKNQTGLKGRKKK